MKRYLRLGLALAFVAAALAANLPRGGAASRALEVRSAFINLGADPGAGGLLRLDFLVSNAARAARREGRLAHIHPRLLAAHAQAGGAAPQALLRQITDPAVADAFDMTGQTAVLGADPARGAQEAGPWRALVLETSLPAAQDSDIPALEDPPEPERARWLLYFTEEAWYYAPIETPEQVALLLAAHPALAALDLSP